MRSGAKRDAQAEQDRKDREQHNQLQSFLELPAEIRNRIYQIYQELISLGSYALDHDIQMLTEEFDESGQWFYQFLPIFYSKVTGILHLEALIGRPRKVDGNRRNFLDVLDDRSIASIGRLGVHSTARCFGRHVRQLPDTNPPRTYTINGVYIVVDRIGGDVRLALSNTPRPISNVVDGQMVYYRNSTDHPAEQLMTQIESMNLNRMDHDLCKEDIVKLARWMNWGRFRKSVWKFMGNDVV